jgi:hypothetical protein
MSEPAGKAVVWTEVSGNVMPEEGEITMEPKVVCVRLREVGVY